MLFFLIVFLLGAAGKPGEAIKTEEQEAMRKGSVKMETLEAADEAAASAGKHEFPPLLHLRVI